MFSSVQNLSYSFMLEILLNNIQTEQLTKRNCITAKGLVKSDNELRPLGF